MADYQAMLDAVRDGLVNKAPSEIPSDPVERANHLKGFSYFNDASMVGICRISKNAGLEEPYRNPGIDRLAQELKTRQTKTLSAGIDVIMADREQVNAMSSYLNDQLGGDAEVTASEQEGEIRFTTEMNEQALAEFLRSATGNGLSIAQFSEVPMDLEDAFLSVTKETAETATTS